MTLDLDELTKGWDCPPGELRARLIVGRDGQERIQLRLDLGVMQMEPAGRPDGARYHGLPSAREYVEHELRVGGERLSPDDWRELQRELQQTNYRRLAYITMAEDALSSNDTTGTGRFLDGALADTELCLRLLQLMVEEGLGSPNSTSLTPTLYFDRARLRSQLHVVEGQFEEAIEQAEAGASALDQLLNELGYEEDIREDDPAVRYLRDLGRQLRREYGVSQTIRERLEEALEREDFETAADLRDQLDRRQRGLRPPHVSENEPPPVQ